MKFYIRLYYILIFLTNIVFMQTVQKNSIVDNGTQEII